MPHTEKQILSTIRKRFVDIIKVEEASCKKDPTDAHWGYVEGLKKGLKLIN